MPRGARTRCHALRLVERHGRAENALRGEQRLPRSRVLKVARVVEVEARAGELAAERAAEPREVLALRGLRAAHHLVRDLPLLLRRERLLRLRRSHTLLAHLPLGVLLERLAEDPGSVYKQSIVLYEYIRYELTIRCIVTN